MIRLIAGRELQDLFRDRRSVILLILLPIFLYPGFGIIGFLFAIKQLEQITVVGAVGIDLLPGGVPPFLQNGRVSGEYLDPTTGFGELRVISVTEPAEQLLSLPPGDTHRIDVLMIIPPEAKAAFDGDRPFTVEIRNRAGDDLSKLATRRLVKALQAFDDALRESRFAKRQLPREFDRCLKVHEPRDDETPLQRGTDEIRDRLIKFFPFLLVMWALAGALHPAIDLCAGEKERGTMETLLISPASRPEIVAGKFAAVWVFSTITAWWNLLWMGGLCVAGSWYFQVSFFHPGNILLCFLLVLPLTALFSALCLALGVYARSTKEGQYYLLPLFLGTVPLVLFSLMPSVELTWQTSLIPVTGMCLLMQKLIGPDAVSALPFVPVVFAGLLVGVVLAAVWAVRQFHCEDVLFREPDAGAVKGWLAGFGGPQP
ncbi:MAG: ABC transporter permease subunit [Gemmataceae bacterium]|nr:ABC transporter permease subunit [Gemmataceae bacterium]